MHSSAAHEIDCPTSTISPTNQEASAAGDAGASSASSPNSVSIKSTPSSSVQDQASTFNMLNQPVATGNANSATSSKASKTTASSGSSVVLSSHTRPDTNPSSHSCCERAASTNTLSNSIPSISTISPLAAPDTETSNSPFLAETGMPMDLNVFIFSEFRNAVSHLLIFLTTFESLMGAGKIIIPAHQDLIKDTLRGDLCIESPRFFKISKNLSTSFASSESSTSSSNRSKSKLHTVNLKKIISNLQKSDKIMLNYNSKIDKLLATDNTANLKKRNRLIEFSVFLSFKLFKLDILEYFLYLRDCVNPYYYLVNINNTYQTVYEVILFLDHCSNTLSSIKNNALSFQNTNDKQDTFDFIEDFKVRHSAYSVKLEQLFEFDKYFINANGEKTFLSLNTCHPVTNTLRFNKSRIEVLVILILNYHTRYLSLIEKFIKDNTGSTIFQLNLLPTNTSTNNFESLVKFIRRKFSKNIKQIKNCFYGLNSIYINECKDGGQIADNVRYCMNIMEITSKAMRIFNNSFNYLAAVSPLFPSFTDASSASTLRNSVVHQQLYKSHGKVSKSRYSYKRRHYHHQAQIQQQQQQQQQHSGNPHNPSISNFLQQQPITMDVSYLSSSWFIIDDLKKKFDDLLLVKYPQMANFLKNSMQIKPDDDETSDANDNSDLAICEFETLLDGTIYQRFQILVGEIDSMYTDLVYSIDNEDNFSTLSNFLMG